MSNITRAERLAAELRPTIPCDVLKLWADDAAAELRRLAESERALLEALELAASIIGHHYDDTGRKIGELIAATKEARA